MDIIKIDGYSCNDNVVLTLCNAYFGQCYKAFWDSCRFRFRPCGKLGYGFSESDSDIIKNVAELYGLEFRPQRKVTVRDVVKYIKETLQRTGYLVIATDVFYCPWATDYKIRHNPHTIIVTGMAEDGIICTDPAFLQTEVKLPLRELELGYRRVIEPKRVRVLEKNKIVPANKKRWDKKMVKALKRNLRIRDMHCFCQELATCSFEREFGKEANIWYIPLFVELSKVYSGHVRFAQFLQKYQQNMGVYQLKELSEEIETLGSSWHMMYLWVMKMHMEYTGKFGVFTNYKAQMIETVQGIVAREEKVVAKLIQVLKGEQGKEQSEEIKVAPKERPVLLPFNGKSHLCNIGEGDYMPEDVFRIGRKICTSKCTFDVQQRDEKGNDVLNCSGEEIYIGQTVMQICFLGCGLWGSQAAAFTLYDEEGSQEVKRLFVSDWLEEEYLEEETVWSTRFAKTELYGTQDRAKVVQFYMHFDTPRYVEKLRLPSEEKVQLFAMTIISA